VASLPPFELADGVVGDARLEGLVQSLRERLLERVTGGALELPLLPQVAVEVLSLTSRDDSDPRRLSDLLRHDQAMTAHILRIANSPLYRPRTPIDSLPQALARIGFAQIRQIALVVACRQRVFRVKGFEPDVHRAFRHSLGAAIYAREIARARRRDEDEAFLAGLLHDVGRPILFQAVADVHDGLRLADRPAVLSVIAELHATVGASLARRWGLPLRVTEAIRDHHDAATAVSPPELTLLVTLADDLSHYALDADRAGASPATHWTLPRLSLPPDMIDSALSTRQALMETLQSIA
jgi:putative nucleotidyltransferase with HDIG domain